MSSLAGSWHAALITSCVDLAPRTGGGPCGHCIAGHVDLVSQTTHPTQSDRVKHAAPEIELIVTQCKSNRLLRRLWLWMSCPKRWKLRHGLLDVAFPAASINTCIWLHCIFHESTGQEEVDPLSIAAEDSRLMWALFCVVLQCIAV